MTDSKLPDTDLDNPLTSLSITEFHAQQTVEFLGLIKQGINEDLKKIFTDTTQVIVNLIEIIDEQSKELALFHEFEQHVQQLTADKDVVASMWNRLAAHRERLAAKAAGGSGAEQD